MSKNTKNVPTPSVKKQSSLFSFFKKSDVDATVSAVSQPEKVFHDSKEQTQETKSMFVVLEDDKSLFVGRSVRVYWPNEKEWYKGRVESYNVDENTHSILYEDGDVEDLCLDKEKFEFVLESESSINCNKRRNSGGDSIAAAAATKKVKVAPIRKNKRAADCSDSEEEWNLESSDDTGEEEEEGDVSDALSDSEVDSDVDYCSSNGKTGKRLQKGTKAINKKRKAMCESSDDEVTASSSSSKAEGAKRPPMPTSKPSLVSSMSIPSNYSQYSAHSQSSPSPTSQPSHCTPNMAAHSPQPQPHITPSPRQGQGQSSAALGSRGLSSITKTASPPVTSSPPVVTRMPLPEGVTGLGSHDHNFWSWLKPENRRDKEGRTMDHPNYDPRTIRIPTDVLKEQTPAMKQWFEIKQDYFDTVLFFKVGKFYELFHMDADVGMSEADLIYMKGSKAHSGFPEVSYGKYASQLVAKGFRVARVEQTETPEMLKTRNDMLKKRQKPVDKVVAREMCSIMSKGTRTFCHLDDMSILESSTIGNCTSLLLCVKEIPLLAPSECDAGVDAGDAVVEYGLCFVDPVLCTITLAQFQDDILRNRLRTVLAHHKPTEVLFERDAHSQESVGALQLLAPDASTVMLRPCEIPLEGESGSTVALLEQGQYFASTSYPPVLKATLDGLQDGSSALVVAALGGAIRFLQRSLIDYEVLSHGRCYAYVPPDMPASQTGNQPGQTDGTPKAAWVDVNVNETPSAMSVMESPTTGTRKHMILDAITMNNLEILVNTFDHTAKGSLWSFMNRCRTPFGCRLLKEWVCKPLFEVHDIERRSEAVDELMTTFSSEADKVRDLLKGCPDVERLLGRVHANGLKKRSDGRDHPEMRAIMYENSKYNSRKIRDFMDLLAGFDILVKACECLGPAVFTHAHSPLLRMAIAPTTSAPASAGTNGKFPLEEIKKLLLFFRDLFDERQAKADGFIRPKPGKDLDYDQAKADVCELEVCFEDYLKEQKKKSGIAELCYFGTNKDRYQLEVPNSKTANIPKEWTSKTQKKTHRRFWTPFIEETLGRLMESEDRLKEAQMDTMRRVFEKFDQSVGQWSTAISCVSLLDALLALASVSSAPNYTRATFISNKFNEDGDGNVAVVDIRGGRHPMLERSMEERGDGSFIANDVLLGGSSAVDSGLSQDDASSLEYGARMMLVSGPNMGGKSTLLRQTCLIAIMAQIGCKVPADQVILTPVDRIFTRIGASDKILSGQSTFFVELAETAMILKYATKHSLCILDELGRGTSTFDGTAIAHAVCEHLVARVKCTSLFATHYHSLVNDWSLDPRVKLGHMDCFVEEGEGKGDAPGASAPPPGEEVTFLYKLCNGSSPRSYGINVARLARLPQEILVIAQQQSAVFEDQLAQQRSRLCDDSTAELSKKALYVKIYDRIVSIADSDISATEMTWLVREIWQRHQHVASKLSEE